MASVQFKIGNSFNIRHRNLVVCETTFVCETQHRFVRVIAWLEQHLASAFWLKASNDGLFKRFIDWVMRFYALPNDDWIDTKNIRKCIWKSLRHSFLRSLYHVRVAVNGIHKVSWQSLLKTNSFSVLFCNRTHSMSFKIYHSACMKRSKMRKNWKVCVKCFDFGYVYWAFASWPTPTIIVYTLAAASKMIRKLPR